MNKINKLLNENLDEMLKSTKIIETEINDLISISKEKLSFISLSFFQKFKFLK